MITQLVDVEMIRRIKCALELAEDYIQREKGTFYWNDIKYVQRLIKDVEATFPPIDDEAG